MLHIVNQSPYRSNSLASCLRMARAGHALLLTEDGVYAASAASAASEAMAACAGLRLYALEPDVQARGLAGRVAEGITLVDYAGFVALAAEHPTSHSWL